MEFVYKEKGVFLYKDGVEIGKAICQYSENAVNILHVIVEPSMRGNGIAAQLVEHVVSDEKNEGKEIIPTCSYAAAWMREHK